jgi:N-acetyltransferase
MTDVTALEPRTLVGSRVRLEPLQAAHADALAAVGLAPELWALQPKLIATVADMRAYVDEALADERRGVSLCFTIIDARTDAVIGSTRYMDVALAHRRLEIGATWLAPAAQRTGANVEAKLLLLTEAFEQLDVQKVVLKTETLNGQSQSAIRRLGAVEEGTFRAQFISEAGRSRDMVYFAIFAEQWPNVKAGLKERLARH